MRGGDEGENGSGGYHDRGDLAMDNRQSNICGAEFCTSYTERTNVPMSKSMLLIKPLHSCAG